MKQRLIKLFNQLTGLLPGRLPQGVTEFYAWADSISSTYALPTDNKDSLYFALATIIMHLGPQVAYKSKWHFVKAIKAGAAKQIAGGVFQEIKQKQKQAEEAARAAAAAKPVEASVIAS